MRTLTSRLYIPALVLLALACLPVATHADSITLEGIPIESVSFDNSAKTFTVVMDGTDALVYLEEFKAGTTLTSLFLDEIHTVDGTTTEDVIEFDRDTVSKFDFTDPDEITADVTFNYGKFTLTETIVGDGGSGDGNTVPEPTSAALLASGLLGLVGFGRKRIFNYGGQR
jgi:hypothetical protein